MVSLIFKIMVILGLYQSNLTKTSGYYEGNIRIYHSNIFITWLIVGLFWGAKRVKRIKKGQTRLLECVKKAYMCQKESERAKTCKKKGQQGSKRVQNSQKG